jgi:hypothetical protein
MWVMAVKCVDFAYNNIFRAWLHSLSQVSASDAVINQFNGLK